MLSCRQFVHASVVAGAAAALDLLSDEVAAMAQTPGTHVPLTPFKDPLPVPQILRPQEMLDGPASLAIYVRAISQRLHSEMPPTPVWGYEGSFPGPTIEVHRGQRLRIGYINDLPANSEFPVTAVLAPHGTQNSPGRGGRLPNANVASLKPWIVTQLHGGRTAAGSEG
jgi:FtsP/CotA-like multicopper oxidase with cupredoxin domain